MGAKQRRTRVRMRAVMGTSAALGLWLAGCGLGDQASTLSPELFEAAPVAPGPGVTRRLTQAQYVTSIAAIFGDGVVVSSGLEPDLRVDGLTAIGAGVASTSPRGVEQYEQAAYEIAAQAVDPALRGAWMPCELAVDIAADEVCLVDALQLVARRAWRRQPTAEELEPIVAVSQQAAAVLGDAHEGLVYGLAAILQSPWFVFRVELGEDDGTGGWQLTPYELATRLSFLLWNGPPDDALLDSAAAGELDTTDGLDGAAVSMLESPRTMQGLRGWMVDLLHLDALDDLDKDPELFPNMSPTLGDAAKEEVLRGVESVVFDLDDDLGLWLTQRETYVDRELAAIYEVRAPMLEGFGLVSLPEDAPRRGLLGQVGFLALHGHSTSTSATLRGLAIREALMCETLPPPPSGVDTSIPEATGERPTLRDRVQAHLNVDSCAGCHRNMDLVGLALENYDSIGRWRDQENGHDIDPTGMLDEVEVQGLSELAVGIAESPKFTACMVRQLLRRALGRELAAGELEEFVRLNRLFDARGRRIQPLWLDVVSSPLFRGMSVEESP